MVDGKWFKNRLPAIKLAKKLNYTASLENATFSKIYYNYATYLKSLETKKWRT